jgi:hypothetical protein
MDKLLRGTIRFSRMEVVGNNRSVMPFDVLGCTRATLMHSKSIFLPTLRRVFLGNLWTCIVLGIEFCNCIHERGIPCKRESSTCVEYVPALCTHRPSLLPIERSGEAYGLQGQLIWFALREVRWTLLFRGRRSRNKVSVGEPAEGSFTVPRIEEKWERECENLAGKKCWIFHFLFCFFLYYFHPVHSLEKVGMLIDLRYRWPVEKL